MPPTTPQDPLDRSTHSAPPQPVPLQDLERPPDARDVGDTRRQHSHSKSLWSSGSWTRRGHNFGTRYERLGQTPPGPNARAMSQSIGVPSFTPSSHDENRPPISPIDDPADFQAAIGFAGLLVPNASLPEVARVRASSVPGRPTLSGFGDIDGISSDDHAADHQTSFFQSESDGISLTDPNYLQPISGAEFPAPGGRNHGRSKSTFYGVGSDLQLPTQRASRLENDPRDTEVRLLLHGDLPRSYSTGVLLAPDDPRMPPSPSTASAFSRAASVVRTMSQRVVNLSGEAELIEISARRHAAASSSVYSLSDEPVIKNQQKDKIDPEPLLEQAASNPLKGKSLGIFSAESKIRNRLCALLTYPLTEPAILLLIVLQTILIAIDSSHSVYIHPRPTKWGESPIDYALMALFIIFTIEIAARVIVSGFIFNASEHNPPASRGLGLKDAAIEKYRTMFARQRRSSLISPHNQVLDPLRNQTILQSFTAKPGEAARSVESQRLQLARRAFLRHSFNRLDFVAVCSFWIAFSLAITGIAEGSHLYVFQMLSSLRILRLLALTRGTAIILRSLKKATPLLVNVSFLIGFFWLLFAIIGVQSFKSSFDRQCVWVNATDQFNASGTWYTNVLQFCGGHLNNDTGAHEPWLTGPLDNLVNGTSSPKGFLCPQGSLCLQLEPDQLPYNGTVNFDNIFQSLELVFVIMTANTFTDLMYYTTDSDHLAAALFFAAGIMIMMLWLLNLLIAVITSSFQVIRQESMSTMFGNMKSLQPEEEVRPSRRISALESLYDKTYWFWIMVIAYDLVCQACRSAYMSEDRAKFIENSEVVVTFVLLVEIVIRFTVNWRGFFRDKRNWCDLALAIITMLILLPPIRRSGQPYAWLTGFQILRIYRIIMAVPVTRDLITLVLGNSRGIGNLILFVFLATFLFSIFAVQLFRGELTPYDPYGNVIHVTFFTIYNTFLGMYQILSSENWTINLYNITAFDTARNTAWIGAVFFIGWYILANFILLNMFIAVIHDSFDVSEDEKRMHQIKSFLNRKELGSSSNLPLSAIFRFGRSRTARDLLDHGPATIEMLLKDAVIRDFLDDEAISSEQPAISTGIPTQESVAINSGLLHSLRLKFVSRVWNREPNPFYSNIYISGGNVKSSDAKTLAKEAVSATSQRKKAQREFLAKHPNYNNSLFLFKPDNPLRRFCQNIVGPCRGSERYDGVEPNAVVWYAFSAFIYVAIVAMVLLACITTPLYQKEYFDKHTFSVRNWFVWTDMAFTVIFTIEALIKIIADGFFWTPNAFFRSTWGFIDGIVLISLWINVGTSLSNDGVVSRAVGAFKALRALRLLNVSDSARNTFHSLMIVGGWKIFSAAFVSLSLLVPFAIYGVNLFNGQMFICNDNTGDIANLSSDCFGEWNSTPFSNNWPMLAPRTVTNPYYNFDSFGDSLFILFQIVSQEGWVDVMWSAESITSRGLQPAYYASQGNAIFFVIFNLLGRVFILTLFISVFMRNYTEQTGVAFLTSDQRSWLELRKLLRQISPSKRPATTGGTKWKDWCYKMVVRRHSKWQQVVTVVLVLHLILLLVEYYPESAWWDLTRDYIFLALTIFYMTNIIIRLIGLGWARFKRSSWDLYSLFAVLGTFISTVLLLTNFNSQTFIQFRKLFLVSILLLIIPRNDALDQLFKTAAASLASIGNLLATWFVLFLVFAIAMTQTFGLTRFGSQEADNLNFRNVPKALILLFRMSIGDGWNQIMEDYARILPPLCVEEENFFKNDCGSALYAKILFISWNILSMYIFTSLFVSLIYESFSYVYQHSSGLEKVSREELRRFKQAWATFDPEGTGFISKEVFPRLLGELSGIFEMRIYGHENSVCRILEDIQPQPTERVVSSMPSVTTSPGVDLAALNNRLAKIDFDKVRQAKARYNLFYEEIMVSADVDRGISFTTVLMTLAHYNVISDNKSLKLEEFLRRRTRLRRVEEEVRRRIVLGFFDTMYWSRTFRRYLERKRSGRMTDIPQLGPEIYVDDADNSTKQVKQPEPSLLSPLDISDNRRSFITHGLDAVRRHATNLSLSGSPGSPRPSPRLSPHKTTSSAFSFEGLEGSDRAGSGEIIRRESTISAENMLKVLDNSAWGESIRRSFTMKRPRGGAS